MLIIYIIKFPISKKSSPLRKISVTFFYGLWIFKILIPGKSYDDPAQNVLCGFHRKVNGTQTLPLSKNFTPLVTPVHETTFWGTE